MRVLVVLWLAFMFSPYGAVDRPTPRTNKGTSHMKRLLPLTLTAAVFTGVLATPVLPAFAQTKGSKATAGKACAKVGAVSGSLTCVKSGSKSAWAATPTTAAPAAPASSAAPAATTAPVSSVAPAANPTKLVFAPVPAENALATAANWAPFVKALSDMVGVPIEQVATTDYAGVTEGVLAGKVDIAMYGPLSYYIATQAGAKIKGAAIQTSSFGASETYQSFLFTRAGRTDINSIADVKGKKVCFGDPESTSGTLFPFLMLADAGIDSQKDITNVVAGAHDRSILGVINGSCDAGFAFDTIVNSPSGAASSVKSSDLKIVARSKPIPNSPMAVRSDLPPALFKKIVDAIPQIDSLYLQANNYCPSSAPRCGPGSLGNNQNQSWKPVTSDAWVEPVAQACKLPAAPSSCRPAKK
jgi:phosphonate transport system substrate-binding protein